MDAIQAAIAKARAARATALTGEAPPAPAASPALPEGPLQAPPRPALLSPDPAAPPAPGPVPLPLPAESRLDTAPPDSVSASVVASTPASTVAPLRLGEPLPAASAAAPPPAAALSPAPSPAAAPPPAAVPADPATSRKAPTAPAPAAPAAGSAAPEAGLRDRWQALPEFVPQPKLLARNHIVTAAGGREAAPFDQMRTRLLQQMRANNWRRVAITSPGPGCGKSTVALNLALSLARQAELRTVLVELDLRRPSLARLLGLPGADRRKAGRRGTGRDGAEVPAQDFPRVLDGRDPFAAHAARIGGNLAFSTCRGPARNPAELMHSPAAGAALQRIEADYAPTIFLFDTPPVLMVDDAMAVMGQMDCALIVAAAESTRIAEIDRCERELASQTSVLGVVLNKCRYMDQGYDYGYYGG